MEKAVGASAEQRYVSHAFNCSCVLLAQGVNLSALG